MAFLRSDDQNQDKNLIGGAGGIAGQGAAVGGTGRTAAGRPGSWYNIQDFLAANPNPTIAQKVEQRGAEGLGQARQQMQGQLEGLQQAPTPEMYSQDRFSSIREGGINPNETQNLSSFLGQTLGNVEQGQQAYEKTPEQQLKDVQNPFSNVKSGDFGSIMNWYGDAERPSSNYTPGMQKMDEMLLRGSDTAKKFPEQMQSQFKTEISDPIQQRRDQLRAEQEQSKRDFEQQRTDWTQGISSFLQGEDKKIQDIYEQQKQKLAEENQRTIQDIVPNYYEDLKWLDPNLGKNITTKGNVGPGGGAGQYFSRGNIVNPDINTAALEYFGNPQDRWDYNSLMGLVDSGTQYDPSAEAFNTGAYSFNKDQFVDDWQRKYKGTEQDRLKQMIESYKTPSFTESREPFVVPEYFDTKYGRVLNDMAEAGQTINPVPFGDLGYLPIEQWGQDQFGQVQPSGGDLSRWLFI